MHYWGRGWGPVPGRRSRRRLRVPRNPGVPPTATPPLQNRTGHAARLPTHLNTVDKFLFFSGNSKYLLIQHI